MNLIQSIEEVITAYQNLKDYNHNYEAENELLANDF
jgi:hypothetical protein